MCANGLREPPCAARRWGTRARAERFRRAGAHGTLADVSAQDATLKRLTPDRRLALDGQIVSPELAGRISRITVELADDFFTQCTIVFTDPGLELIGSDRITAGTAIEVELGYQGALKPVFEGEVVSIEPRFVREKPPSLVVRALEPLHRLALAPRTRSFADVDPKQVVNAIAHEHGLSGDGPQGSKGHLLQANISDFQLLRKIAARTGQHLYLSGKKLVLGPPPKLEEMQVVPGEGLKRLKVKLRPTEQVPKVVVRGWDPKTKKEIVAQAKPSGEAAEGTKAAKPFARKELVIEGPQVFDTSEAEKLAKAAVARIAERFAVAEGEMVGNAELLPGKVINFDKLGELLDGKYRVTSARHEFDRRGYRVHFAATRVAKKKSALKFKATKANAADAKSGMVAAKITEALVGTEQETQTSFAHWQIVDGDGNPVSGLKARFEIEGEEPRIIDGGENGVFRIDEVEEGKAYSVSLLAASEITLLQGDEPLSGVKVRVEVKGEKEPQEHTTGEDGRIELDLEHGAEYALTFVGDSFAEAVVLDAEEKPLAGVKAKIEIAGREPEEAVTDKDGKVRVEGLFEDTDYSLSFEEKK